jgi:protein kinase
MSLPFLPLCLARLQPDELYKICCVMGTPTAATWPEGLQLAHQV